MLARLASSSGSDITIRHNIIASIIPVHLGGLSASTITITLVLTPYPSVAQSEITGEILLYFEHYVDKGPAKSSTRMNGSSRKLFIV